MPSYSDRTPSRVDLSRPTEATRSVLHELVVRVYFHPAAPRVAALVGGTDRRGPGSVERDGRDLSGGLTLPARRSPPRAARRSIEGSSAFSAVAGEALSLWGSFRRRAGNSDSAPEASGGLAKSTPACWKLRWHVGSSGSASKAPTACRRLRRRVGSFGSVLEASDGLPKVTTARRRLRQPAEGYDGASEASAARWKLPAVCRRVR